MVTAVKVKAPAFYGRQAPTTTKPSGDSKPLILAILVIVGVALVFIMRGKDKALTGPVLTVVPDNATDISSLNNMTQAVNALATLRGGVSTPLTPSPNS